MALVTPLNTDLKQLANEHQQWLSDFDQQYLVNWKKLFRADNEAALTEAGIRRMLHQHGVTVEPNEKLTGSCGGPDFRCTVNGSHFYVEVTCITIATAEKRSGIKDGVTGFSPFNVMGMTEATFSECKNKAPQCSNLDGPALVAVGTFHGTAAMVGFEKELVNCVLTGKTKMAWDINIKTGQQIGDSYQTTELHSAAFLRRDNTQKVGFARQSISGVLLCAVGLGSLRTIGVLHPNATRPFNPVLLPNIEFGSVTIDQKSLRLCVDWPGGNNH